MLSPPQRMQIIESHLVISSTPFSSVTQNVPEILGTHNFKLWYLRFASGVSPPPLGKRGHMKSTEFKP